VRVKVLTLHAEGLGEIVDGELNSGKLRFLNKAVIVNEKRHILIEEWILFPFIKRTVPLFLVDWNNGQPIQIYPKPSKKPSKYNPEIIAQVLDIEILSKLIGKKPLPIEWKKIVMGAAWICIIVGAMKLFGVF